MRLIAFLQSWDLLRAELGRPPTIEEYAKRFALAQPTAYRVRKLFEEAFQDQSPDEVLDLLWGWHDARGGPLLGARVADAERASFSDWVRDFADRWAGVYPPDRLEELRKQWER